ncbi:sulfurtransferase, partial [Stenotrophomonas indicatrix]|uniref:sulfurtransferase n=1 Tax=Stenotrophomonas indicatrix TaxID=2045451 RepID=UPI0028A1F9E8
PLATGSSEVTALPAYPGRFDSGQVASADEIESRLKHAPGWLVDARAGERFRGEVEPLDPVAGHVPGAVNRPFALNVLDGRLRDAQELRAELQGVIGNQDPQRVVLMCGSGVTACHLLLAMESAGLSGARIYADSWSGWVSDSSHPVATGA